MVLTEKFPFLIRQTLQTETQALHGVVKDTLRQMPTTSLALAVGRELYIRRSELFPSSHCEWIMDDHPLKSHPAHPLFCLASGNDEPEFIQLEVCFLNGDQTAAPEAGEGMCRKIVAALLIGTETDCIAAKEAWIRHLGFSAKPLGGPARLSNDAESSLWLQVWELLPTEAGHADESEIGHALRAAVVDMSHENMVSILGKILCLRTNLSHEALSSDDSLEALYKRSFAREQGVRAEEVYDPEAFNGYTYSQLAVQNFLEDMQKTFGIYLASDEREQIVTLKDLAGFILKKKYAGEYI